MWMQTVFFLLFLFMVPFYGSSIHISFPAVLFTILFVSPKYCPMIYNVV